MRARSLLLGLSLVAVATASPSARADSIWVNTAGGGGGGGGNAKNALELPRVRISDIREGKIFFDAATGRESSRELAQVVRLDVEDDPSLTAAEQSLATSQWDAATDGYRKVLTSSPKPWAKYWAAQRLIEAAGKAKRFDEAAAGYIALVRFDPARAAPFKPALPDERSTYLTTALNDVAAALADGKLAPPQREGLLSFQLDLQRAKKDSKGAAETTEKLLQVGAASGGDNGAAAASALAKLKLDQAAAALAAKRFDQAIADVRSMAASLTDPRDQSQALYLLAEAQSGMAAARNDTTAWQDAALAYMRVVAHFKDSPAATPLVTKSLLKAAQIAEKLNDKESARLLYDQLAVAYPDDPAAAEAKSALARLKQNP
jgi:TolA-binding protein